VSDYDPRTYGDRIAEGYDEWFPHALLQTDASIELLTELAGPGPVLAELDLMAALAGLRLRERWGGWEREAFGPQSGRHVSIYEALEG
jgi:hypothetical protein